MVSASVIVCTYNRAHLLRRALEPAASQARECGAEVLVVDNASTDDTSTVVGALARDLAPTLRTAHEPHLQARRTGNIKSHAEVMDLKDQVLSDS